jgi:ketosteroid isomerase-like protein
LIGSAYAAFARGDVPAAFAIFADESSGTFPDADRCRATTADTPK